MAEALSATLVPKSRSSVRKKAIEVIKMAGWALDDLVSASLSAEHQQSF